MLEFVDKLTLVNPHEPGISESLKSLGGGGQMAHNRKLALWDMILHFKDHKPYQGTLGTLKVILIGSRTRPGPSMDPTGTLKLTGNIPGFVHLLYIIHCEDPLNI